MVIVGCSVTILHTKCEGASILAQDSHYNVTGVKVTLFALQY